MGFFEKQLSWVKENKLMAVGIGVVGLIIFGWINLEVIHFSSSPPFCKGLCHTMTAEVEDWEASSHAARKVDCVSCHYREGTINYMINKVVALESLVSTVSGDMGRGMEDEEHFGAEKHLEYMSEEQLEEEKLMDDAVLPMYIHNPEKDRGADPSNYADEEGNWRIQLHRYGFLWRIVDENCVNCHSFNGNRGMRSDKNIADFVVEDALFDFVDKTKTQEETDVGGRRPLGGFKAPHAFHLDRGIACIDCHQEIVHGSQELKDDHYKRSGERGNKGVVWPRMVVCFRCHNDQRATRDCLFCHEHQKSMNLGLNGIGVEQIDGMMYPDDTDCMDCHLEENNWKMNAQICVDCHDDEDMAETLVEWQTQTQESLNELETQLKEMETAINKALEQGQDVFIADELFRDAYQNYKIVWYDGSKGAHNIEYAEALLSISQEKVKLASDMLIAY